MLPAATRLRRRREFVATLRRGPGTARAARPHLVVHLAAPPKRATESLSPGHLPPRVGFAVSRAVGNAVTRNAVRRRLRHLVRARLDRLPPGSRLVVRALPAAAAAPSRTLGQDLDAALGSVLRRIGPGASA